MNTPHGRELQKVFEQTPVALAMLEGPEHILAFANSTFQTLFQLPKDVVGQRAVDLFPGADSQGFISIMDEVFSTGTSFVSQATPFKQQLPDGRVRLFYLDIVYEPRRNAHGEVVGLIASANDVTEAVTAREELERSQAQLNLVLANAKFGTWSLNLKTNQTRVSRKTEEIFGIAPGEAFLEAIQAAMHPEDSAEANRRWQTAAASGESYVDEYRVLLSNGEVRWVISKGITTNDANGEPTIFTGIIEDITEQKLAGQKLAEQFKRFDSLVSNVPDLLAILDPELRYLYLNKAILKLAMVTLSDSIGKRPSDIRAFDGSIANEFESILLEVARTKKLGHASFSIETPKGLRHFDYTVAPILSSDGELEGLTASGHDVTAQREANRILREKEERLERSERILRSAIEIARIGYFEWDFKNDVIRFSDRMQNDWDFEAGSTGHDAAQYIDEQDRARVLELSAKTRDEKTFFETEYRVNRTDGRQIWIKAHGEYFYNADGEPIEMVGTSVDVTAEKRAQQQLQAAKVAAENASQAKSAFLANMSHEIRTPLGAIMGFAELLRDPKISDSDRDHYLEIILRNGHSLARVIDDVLDLSKVEAGRLQVEMTSASIRETIEDVLALFSDKARKKGIKLLSFAEGAIPSRVMTDPIRLRQILINIVGNAVKFTDSGMIMVATEASFVDGEWVFEISVKDSGRGLSRDQADQLFQPFVQADASTTRRYGGTGLGLVLSRRLARALGGDVVISDCELGKGCTFVVSIRAAEASVSETIVALSAASIEGLRLLVVEDTPDNQKLIEKILLMAGASVEVVSDPHVALQRALDGDFDALLLDIQMPGMDGYQLLSELRSRHFSRPVLALTAHALAEEREKTRAAGFAAHITKPIDRADLIAALARVTSR